MDHNRIERVRKSDQPGELKNRIFFVLIKKYKWKMFYLKLKMQHFGSVIQCCVYKTFMIIWKLKKLWECARNEYQNEWKICDENIEFNQNKSSYNKHSIANF